MSGIVLHHHTGLGDHFMCNAIVHHMARKYGEVDLIVKEHLVNTICHLYEDYDNIFIVPVTEEFEQSVYYANYYKKDLHRIGFDKCDMNNFEESFYRQVGLDPQEEYDGFIFPSNLEKSKEFCEKVVNEKGKDYIFVHDVSSYRSFNLKIESKLPRFTVNKEDTDDVLDYIDTICNAKEIHVINSGLNNLVFQLHHKGKIKTSEIYFHDARKPEHGGIPVKIPAGIKIVNYESEITNEESDNNNTNDRIEVSV
jgi:hypothetical protein